MRVVYLEVPSDWIEGHVVNKEEGFPYTMLDQRSTRKLGNGKGFKSDSEDIAFKWGQWGIMARRMGE